MKSKEKRRGGVYDILDWLEKERGQFVKKFFSCVFQDHILQKYPVLRLLRNSLMDGQLLRLEEEKKKNCCVIAAIPLSFKSNLNLF